MNNTLEGINSRITEAEEWINDQEDRMVPQITAPEQNIEKRIKRNEEISGTTLNAPTLALQGSQKQEREKGPGKIFEEVIAESFPNMGKEIIK